MTKKSGTTRSLEWKFFLRRALMWLYPGLYPGDDVATSKVPRGHSMRKSTAHDAKRILSAIYRYCTVQYSEGPKRRRSSPPQI